MTTKKKGLSPQPLTLTQELILTLLNEENGYFHQVPGWQLNCAVAGGVLADLSLRSRIDTDAENLFLLDANETGIQFLDCILKVIAAESEQHNTHYWIERLAPQAERIIDSVLEGLVKRKILEYHDGDFWTLSPIIKQSEMYGDAQKGTHSRFIKARISEAIFTNVIPDPKDIIIISLIKTCDVLRFIFQLDEEAEERIEFICKMDLIGRSIAKAVGHNLAGPMLRHASLAKKIPRVPLHKLALNRHTRNGNIPALFADLTKAYGPVFEIRPPFQEPMIFLSGVEANRWVHKYGRRYLRVREYFADFEKLYGAVGVLPSLDGADHFRLRKALSPAYSRGRLVNQLDHLFGYIRNFMGDWKVGDVFPATRFCRFMINAQLSPMFISTDTQDLLDDLVKYKERALSVHIMKALPEFMLKTPGMKRRARVLDTLMKRVQSVHTPAQRAGCPRGLADDLLSLHVSDPQLVPESNLLFALSAALIASVYLGDGFSFTLYAMASQPKLYKKIRREADALFKDGDPVGKDFTPASMEVTHRLIMETMRMYPIVPMSIRNVMNSCVVEGYQLPVGSRLCIAQTTGHYMEELFPDPFKFDIDRYLPPRNEHQSPGYAPYGLGTHKCLGTRWMELQLSINLLMVAHYFTLEVHPTNYKLRFDPIPSMKPSKKLKFRVAEQVRDLPS